MEKFVYYSLLLDIYDFLITENKRKIFSLYYDENLTMQEIADLMQVSKSFIGSSIKTTEQKLTKLENELQILKTNERLKELLKIDDLNILKQELEKLIK